MSTFGDTQSTRVPFDSQTQSQTQTIDSQTQSQTQASSASASQFGIQNPNENREELRHRGYKFVPANPGPTYKELQYANRSLSREIGWLKFEKTEATRNADIYKKEVEELKEKLLRRQSEMLQLKGKLLQTQLENKSLTEVVGEQAAKRKKVETEAAYFASEAASSKSSVTDTATSSASSTKST